MFIDIFTDYSLLSSLIKIEDLITFAKEKKWGYVGIADDNAGSLLDFYLSCKESDIKPIIGLRLPIVATPETVGTDKIILYPKNLDGYKALLRLSSRANLEGFKGDQPNLVVHWLKEESANLLCVLPVAESSLATKTPESETIVTELTSYFGKLYYGLYNRDCGQDDFWLAKASQFSYLPLCGARYIYKNAHDAYKTLQAIKEKTTVERLFKPTYLDESLEAALEKTIPNQSLECLEGFVNQINLDIPCPGLKVPKFKVPEGFESSCDYLIHLCREGFKAQKEEFATEEQRKACSERMKLELDVMKRCELADYFLLIYEICKYCDDNDIPRGISRGSAGGSLVCFLLGVSRVNPLQYGLLFERFLNEDRTRPVIFNGETYLTDAPDIDLDVSQLNRQKIIDFLREKYGFVTKISTYTSLTSKACIKAVMRAHGRYESEAMAIASFVEVIFGKGKPLEKTYEEVEGFREWANENKKLYETALKLQDVKRNVSIHAAGLIASDKSIDNNAPLILANHTVDQFKQDVCSAYSLDFAAKAALTKFDLLGLRTTDVLQATIKLIKNDKRTKSN